MCDNDITEAEYDDAEVAGVPRDSGPVVMAMAAWWWAALWRFHSFLEGPCCRVHHHHHPPPAVVGPSQWSYLVD